jgi:Na+-transporting NADH:ubiquinone oxidoreductase subunit NqrF
VNEIKRASSKRHIYAALSKRHIYASEFYDQSDKRIDNYAKEIIFLSKIYRDEDRFSDSEDNFEFKLLIFFDRCSQMNLSKHAYLKAVSIMLSDQTLTYYYSNKVTYFIFDDFCANMRAYFESFE